MKARELGDYPAVEEALMAFADNPELENEVGLIQAIIEAYEQQKLIDLTDKLRTAGWRPDCDAQYSNLAKLAKEERWI